MLFHLDYTTRMNSIISDETMFDHSSEERARIDKVKRSLAINSRISEFDFGRLARRFHCYTVFQNCTNQVDRLNPSCIMTDFPYHPITKGFTKKILTDSE